LKNADAPRAAKKSIALISRLSGPGTAGIITVDLKGRVGFAYNTAAMGTAWYDTAKGRIAVRA
jgi:isoaspartyl peptidase/L-asparaginase-like protein (Ntn-hydrolase superfamily)